MSALLKLSEDDLVETTKELVSPDTPNVSEEEHLPKERLGDAEKLDALSSAFGQITSRISTLAVNIADTFGTVNDVTDALTQQVTEVHNHSESIHKISTQTRMLAINAGVMAAHTGETGKGFSVIAESVSELSDQTSDVSRSIISCLGSLEKTMGKLLDLSENSNEVAKEARKIDEEFRKFRDFGEEVENLVTSISDIEAQMTANNKACTKALSDLGEIDNSSKRNFDQLQATRSKFDSLVSFTEDVILLTEESGVETEDTLLIRECMDKAIEVSKIFEDAISTGRISKEDLFDENYMPITGSNPEQVMTGFTKFTDETLVELQETIAKEHERFAFCVAIDNMDIFRHIILPYLSRKGIPRTAVTDVFSMTVQDLLPEETPSLSSCKPIVETWVAALL